MYSHMSVGIISAVHVCVWCYTEWLASQSAAQAAVYEARWRAFQYQRPIINTIGRDVLHREIQVQAKVSIAWHFPLYIPPGTHHLLWYFAIHRLFEFKFQNTRTPLICLALNTSLSVERQKLKLWVIYTHSSPFCLCTDHFFYDIWFSCANSISVVFFGNDPLLTYNQSHESSLLIGLLSCVSDLPSRKEASTRDTMFTTETQSRNLFYDINGYFMDNDNLYVSWIGSVFF
jgi:hypothetical protein